jgi:hypothetical protein
MEKSKVMAAVLATLLTLSMFTIVNSSPYTADALLQKLQFPKSQQADLMVINSGNAPTTENFNVTEGYIIQPILWNLILPSAVTFDGNGRNMFLAEAGYGYGEIHPQPRILKVDLQNGNASILVDRLLNGLITDIIFYNGKSLFV